MDGPRGSGSGGTLEDDAAVAQPRDARGADSLEGFQQGGQVAFLLQRDGAQVGSEADVGGVAEQAVVEGAGGEAAVAGGQVAGEQAQQVVGQDGDGEVEVDLDDHRGGEAVEVEEGELFGDGLFDEPAAGIAAEDGGEAGLEVVGEQEGGTAA